LRWLPRARRTGRSGRRCSSPPRLPASTSDEPWPSWRSPVAARRPRSPSARPRQAVILSRRSLCLLSARFGDIRSGRADPSIPRSGQSLHNLAASPSAAEVMRSTTAVRPNRSTRESPEQSANVLVRRRCGSAKSGGPADLAADQQWIRAQKKSRHSHWSEAGWWAWEDLNLRPHPYQVSRAKRCADRRFPRSPRSVGGEGMRSNSLTRTGDGRADGMPPLRRPAERLCGRPICGPDRCRRGFRGPGLPAPTPRVSR
jgi:hypothetical protein